MSNCPFCQNDQKLIIEESKLVKVIFSNPRLTRGHLLVIPKRHIETIWELKDQEIKETFHFLQIFQKKIVEKIGTGCDTRQNYRPFLKQSKLKVNHLHFHLIPRTLNDEIFQKVQKHQVEIFKDLTNRERASVLKLLG
jgi:diadenosine tetraphosphate (Ap4A) HIT family hydrolase